MVKSKRSKKTYPTPFWGKFLIAIGGFYLIFWSFPFTLMGLFESTGFSNPMLSPIFLYAFLAAITDIATIFSGITIMKNRKRSRLFNLTMVLVAIIATAPIIFSLYFFSDSVFILMFISAPIFILASCLNLCFGCSTPSFCSVVWPAFIIIKIAAIITIFVVLSRASANQPSKTKPSKRSGNKSPRTPVHREYRDDSF